VTTAEWYVVIEAAHASDIAANLQGLKDQRWWASILSVIVAVFC